MEITFPFYAKNLLIYRNEIFMFWSEAEQI